ncbi:MAG: preprotein translocase subunit SecG [Inquilinaceae bacterium]
MEQIVLIIHLIIAVVLVGVVLLQRSEGGGLGMGGGGGGGAGGGMMSMRGTANLLTRTTAILAAAFMATSMILAILAGNHGEPRSILEQMPVTPVAPPAAEGPVVPLSD